MSNAAWRDIAADLRSRIARGDEGYRPGDRLPTYRQLAIDRGVTPIVTKRVYRELLAEGLVESHRRAGYFVRVRPPVERRATDRYVKDARRAAGLIEEPGTSFTHDQGISFEEQREGFEKHFERITADQELAELFNCPVGTEVLARHFVFWAHGQPQQVSRSCMLWSDVAGTRLEHEDSEPQIGGTPAQMQELGWPLTRVEESVSTRMPTPGEVEKLRIGPGVPVLAITRRMLSGERVLEVAADIVIPGDRVVLDYAIDIPPADA